MKTITSNRLYRAVWFETELIDLKSLSLEDIFEDVDNLITEAQQSNFEWQYAIQDKIDNVLDMKKDETIYFQFNRDDENTKGILKRIQ